MNSIGRLGEISTGSSLPADSLIEFHASRILLLIFVCGTGKRIDGLTKMAKLDFFVRYPAFFASLSKALGKPVQDYSNEIESHMVRYHYGPWDKRYYRLLSYLKARNLITIVESGNRIDVTLTQLGARAASKLAKEEVYVDLVEHMRNVKQLLGHRTGNAIKALIYKTFDVEVAQSAMGKIIE